MTQVILNELSRIKEGGTLIKHPGIIYESMFPNLAIPRKVFDIIVRPYPMEGHPQGGYLIASMSAYSNGSKSKNTFNHREFASYMYSTFEGKLMNFLMRALNRNSSRPLTADIFKENGIGVIYGKNDGWTDEFVRNTLCGFRGTVFYLSHYQHMLEFWMDYEKCWNCFGFVESARDFLLVREQVWNEENQVYELATIFNSAEHQLQKPEKVIL
ncbi:MAG: hypothetical protein ACYDG2_16115 [Ruminiclostridium sp.]